MILDVIFVVLLLVIVGLLLFFWQKRFAPIEQRLTDLIRDEHQQHSDSIKQELANLIRDEHQHSDSVKEELIDLIQERTPAPLPPVIEDFDIIRNEFRKYVKRESTILQWDGIKNDHIRFKTGIPRVNGSHPVWITAWIPNDNKISAGIYVDKRLPFFSSHYKKLKVHKSEIEVAFSFDTTIEINKLTVNTYQLRVQKKDVDLTQTADWETEFHWLRENLEKLYWVLQIQDTGPGWDAW